LARNRAKSFWGNGKGSKLGGGGENQSTMLIYFSFSYATGFLNKLILQCDHLHMEM